MPKGALAYRSIAEAAEEVGVAQHVLRFWETKFPEIRPLKRAGGRRFYRPEDIRILHGLRRLLHDEGRSIQAVQAMRLTRAHHPSDADRPAPRRNAAKAPPKRLEPALGEAEARLWDAFRRAEQAKTKLDILLQTVKPT